MMTEQELMRLLRAVHKLDIEEQEKRIATERANCLPFTRARALVLDPTLWTESERSHLDTCRYCARLIETIERNIHPSLWALFLWQLGELSGDEAQVVQYHLESDRCRRCLRLTQSLWLQGLVGAVRTGQRTLAQLEMLLKALPIVVSNTTPLPAPVPAFAPKLRPPFHIRSESQDGLLVVTVRETDEGELVAYVETPNRELFGRKVKLELLGEGETLTAEVTFDFQHEHGCVGQHSFGQFAELAPRLGSDCQVFAVLTE